MRKRIFVGLLALTMLAGCGNGVSGTGSRGTVKNSGNDAQSGNSEYNDFAIQAKEEIIDFQMMWFKKLVKRIC